MLCTEQSPTKMHFFLLILKVVHGCFDTEDALCVRHELGKTFVVRLVICLAVRPF